MWLLGVAFILLYTSFKSSSRSYCSYLDTGSGSIMGRGEVHTSTKQLMWFCPFRLVFVRESSDPRSRMMFYLPHGREKKKSFA